MRSLDCSHKYCRKKQYNVWVQMANSCRGKCKLQGRWLVSAAKLKWALNSQPAITEPSMAPSLPLCSLLHFYSPLFRCRLHQLYSKHQWVRLKGFSYLYFPSALHGGAATAVPARCSRLLSTKFPLRMAVALQESAHNCRFCVATGGKNMLTKK